jgi:hypothetical protein
MLDEDVERVFVNVGVCEEHGQLDCSGRVFKDFRHPTRIINGQAFFKK